MSETGASDDLRSRIHRLERELIDLRRSLDTGSEPLPTVAFDALELFVGDGRYLLPVEVVHEVLQAILPQALPDSPPWVMGTFQYGSIVMPMIDLGQRLTGRETVVELEHAVVLVRSPRWAGLHVDAAGEVLRVDPRRLAPPVPGIPQAPFVVGTLADERGDGLHLLSPERLAREFVLAE